MMDASGISPVRALRERMNLSFMDAIFAWDLCPSDLQGLEECWFDRFPPVALIRIVRGTTPQGELKGFPTAFDRARMRALSKAYQAWVRCVFAQRRAETRAARAARKKGAA